jgi:hypothetical protein
MLRTLLLVALRAFGAVANEGVVLYVDLHPERCSGSSFWSRETASPALTRKDRASSMPSSQAGISSRLQRLSIALGSIGMPGILREIYAAFDFREPRDTCISTKLRLRWIERIAFGIAVPSFPNGRKILSISWLRNDKT